MSASLPATPCVRWGFLSTANIARKNASAVASTPSGRLVAVASRSRDKAAAWLDAQLPVMRAAAVKAGLASDFPAPAACGSYDELLASGAPSDRDAPAPLSVDAVYCPLPTALHHEWVVKAARAGKHVLCDKPAACSFEQLDDMVSACDAAGVQFMDGVMFMHHERMAALEQYVHGGKPLTEEPVLQGDSALGRVSRVHCELHFQGGADFFSGNIRVSKELEPFGCIGDLGWYCIRMALWTFKWELPESVCGVAGEVTDEGVPLSASVIIRFGTGRTASFNCSFNEFRRQEVCIAGSAGMVTFTDFVNTAGSDTAPFKLSLTSVDADAPPGRRGTTERVVSAPSTYQEAAMFRHFNELVLSGRRDARWPHMALATQAVADAVMASIAAGGSVTRIPDAHRTRVAALAARVATK